MEFIEFMKARQEIYLAKERGDPWPWSDDPIFQKYSFTNVYRENDKTTVWFHENIRGYMRNTIEVIFATIAFRWFNRISTGEILIGNRKFSGVKSPKGLELFYKWDPEWCIRLLEYNYPVVTGAYIIKTPNGMDKLHGVVDCINNAWKKRDTLAKQIRPNLYGKSCDTSLEMAWNILQTLPFMGPFMAYEVVTDFRHTRILDSAPDIYMWANPGPGARRGINRINHGKAKGVPAPDHGYIFEMRALLDYCHDQWDGPRLEMRDIEHSLCEYDKYMRVFNGEGRPRSKYHANIHTDVRQS
jgi:hypothetical protein